MECIVLAGGLGTRLSKVVSDRPKCMANIAGEPFLFHVFEYLKKEQIDHVVLSVGYKFEIIQDWVKKTNWPFKISFAIEKEPLGTGGAIKYALEFTNDSDIVILNGDTFFDINLRWFYNKHIFSKAELSVALKTMNHFSRYGNVLLNSNNQIISFLEKEYCDKGQINGGIYLIKRTNLFKNFKAKFSFEQDFLATKFNNLKIFGVIFDEYFIDIGIPEDYQIADKYFNELLSES
mgnify:FL=1